jgi:predicted MFS family arabinose efflux permease
VAYIGIDGCFYANVISYLAVIGALLRMNVPNVLNDSRHATVLQSLRDAFGYVRGERVIMTFLTVSALFNIFGRSYITLLPVFAKDVLGVGASGFGFISAGPGMGTIIGSLSLAFSGQVRARRDILIVILCAFCASLFVFAVSHNAEIAFGFLVAVGALSTVFETLINTAIQLRVVESFRGRVSGFYGLTGGGLREFGGMQAGFVAEWSSAPIAIGAGALALALLGLSFLALRLRRVAE